MAHAAPLLPFPHDDAEADRQAQAAGADVLAQRVVIQEDESADVAVFRVRGEHDTLGNLLTSFLAAQADVIEAAHTPERELILRVQTALGALPPRAALRAALADAIAAITEVELAALRSTVTS